jgi:methyl-accepting chemotaxis protein
MNIKQKMFSTLAVITFLLICVTWLLSSGLDQYSEIKQTEDIVKNLKTDLLQMRRNEKDFLSRNQLSTVDKFNSNYSRMNEELQTLVNSLDGSTFDTSFIKTLKTSLGEYSELFFAIVSKKKTIGLDPKSGLYGNLRTAVHNLEAALDASDSFELKSDMLMLRRHEKDFMLRRDLTYIDKFDKQVIGFLDKLQKSNLPQPEIELAKSKTDNYVQDFHALVEAEKTIGLSDKDGMMGTMRDVTHSLEANLNDFIETVDEQMLRQESQVKRTLYASIIALIIFVVAVLYWLTISISRRIQSATFNMKQIAMVDGDLTRRMDESGRDEIAELGNAFNIFTKKIHDTLKNTAYQITALSDTGNQVKNAASETDTSMQELRENTQSVSVAIEELSSTAHDVATNASNVSASAQHANAQSDEGAVVVRDAIQAINSFASEFREASDTISALRAETDNIGSILDVIRNISEQTNLLALNAAIEAARAGEQGRGFAVVADEVRSLAHRSHESTNQIHELIENLQLGAEKAVSMINRGEKSIVDTVDKAEQAGTSLGMITESIQGINEMITQIATAAEEQSAVVSDISKNMVKIDSLSNKTAEIADGTSDLTSTLATTISEVNREVNTFKFS